MAFDLEQRRELVRSRIVTTQTESWFSPDVPSKDRFFRPNFNLSQIFFTSATTTRLVDAFDQFERPCCLCAPRLAREWYRRGRRVSLLDIDRRFARFSDFVQYDILYPAKLDRSFDLIVVDPPAFDPCWIRFVLGTLAPDTTAMFSVFRADQCPEVLRVFGDYGFRLIDFRLHYCNVKDGNHALFRLYGNRPELFR